MKPVKKVIKTALCILISFTLIVSNFNVILAEAIVKEKSSVKEQTSQDVEASIASPALWSSSSKHFFIPPEPNDKSLQETIEQKDQPETIETPEKSNLAVESLLEPLSKEGVDARNRANVFAELNYCMTLIVNQGITERNEINRLLAERRERLAQSGTGISSTVFIRELNVVREEGGAVVAEFSVTGVERLYEVTYDKEGSFQVGDFYVSIKDREEAETRLRDHSTLDGYTHDYLTSDPHIRRNILEGRATDLRENVSLTASLDKVFGFLASDALDENARISNAQDLFNTIPMFYIQNPDEETPWNLLGHAGRRLLCVLEREGVDSELILAHEIFARLGLSPNEVEDAAGRFDSWRKGQSVTFSESINEKLGQIKRENRLPSFEEIEASGDRDYAAVTVRSLRLWLRKIEVAGLSSMSLLLQGCSSPAMPTGPQQTYEAPAATPLQDTTIATSPPKPARKVDFSGIADSQYYRDSLKWIGERNFGDRGEFSDLYQSYEEDPSHPYSRYIAQYGRTWIYDDALAIYAELKAAKLAELRRSTSEAGTHIENAKKAVTALVNLAQMEEGRGFKGLWHFSYNTIGDNFTDPRGPLGANLWALNAIYSYIIQTGDTTHLGWINSKMKTFVFGQQVMDKGDPRYGLIRAGLYNAVDYARGNAMGYGVYEGDPNAQNENCFVEHNADYVGTLRLAAIAEQTLNGGKGRDFLSELERRHEACITAIIGNFWQDDHFCTAMSGTGRVNTSVAVDNNSWLAEAIMPYDMERAWQSIQYNKREFMTSIRLDGKVVEGLFFFKADFKDPYVTPNPLYEQMVQPEATFGYIDLLMRYVQFTDNDARRQECLDLIRRLYTSMVIIQKHFGGEGTPYATRDIQDYFNTMRAMASTATGAVVTAGMLGVEMGDFIGVTPPKDFTVGGKAPFAAAAAVIGPMAPRPTRPATPKEPTRVAPAKPAAQAPTPSQAPAKGKTITVDGAQNNRVPGNVRIAVTSFSPGRVAVKINAPDLKTLRRRAVVILLKKTDIWYVQPYAESVFEIEPNGTVVLDTFRENLEKGNTWVLVVDRAKFQQLRTKLRDPSYFDDRWEFGTIAPAVIQGVRFDSLGKHEVEMVDGQLRALGLPEGQVGDILSVNEADIISGDLSKIRLIARALGKKVGFVLRRALFHERVHQLLHLSDSVDLADTTRRLKTDLGPFFETIKHLFEAEFGYEFRSDEEFVDELIAKYYTYIFTGSGAELFNEPLLRDIGMTIEKNLPVEIDELLNANRFTPEEQALFDKEVAERAKALGVETLPIATRINLGQIIKLVALSRNTLLDGRRRIGFTRTAEIDKALALDLERRKEVAKSFVNALRNEAARVVREKQGTLAFVVDTRVANMTEDNPALIEELEKAADKEGFVLIRPEVGEGTTELIDKVNRHLLKNVNNEVRGFVDTNDEDKYETQLHAQADRIQLVALEAPKDLNTNPEARYNIRILEIMNFSLTGENRPYGQRPGGKIITSTLIIQPAESEKMSPAEYEQRDRENAQFVRDA